MGEVMMMISNPSSNSSNEQITTTTCTSWKLYDNPFYYPHHHQICSKHLPQVNLPPDSAPDIAPCFWDLTFSKPVMGSEQDITRAQIIDLKAELEYERKARKKAETLNKKLAREVAEERKGREALERICEELAREISVDKEEIGRMKREFEEERKMLRVAEFLREERVQMKLGEAKILFEEKLLELEELSKRGRTQTTTLSGNLSGKVSRPVFSENSCDYHSNVVDAAVESRAESTRFASSEKPSSFYNNISSATVSSSMANIHRKASPEPENPHIKQGIKGFVEFPRVVRAIRSKSRHWGKTLECQKAQLKIHLKQKAPFDPIN